MKVFIGFSELENVPIDVIASISSLGARRLSNTAWKIRENHQGTDCVEREAVTHAKNMLRGEPTA